MVITVRFVLLLLACMCFVLAAADVKATRLNLLPLGLALWVFALLWVG